MMVKSAGKATQHLDPALRQHLFEYVHTLVQDHYVDSDFGGVDWSGIRERYLQRVLEAEDDRAVYQVLREMVGLLEGASFLSPEEAQAEDAEGFVGIGLSYSFSPTFEAMNVDYVFPNSPAEEAGLRRRDRILAIDGQPCPTRDKLLGLGGTRVELTVRSPDAAPREITVARRAISVMFSPLVRRLEDAPSLVSLYIPAFEANTPAQILTTLESLSTPSPLEGLMIDLRGGGDGMTEVMTDIAGFLLREEVALGNLTARTGSPSTLWAGLSSRSGPFYRHLETVPLVVLVDETTRGVGEMLAAALQFRGRAQVVGEQTLGNTLEQTPHSLLGGARLWLAQADFSLPDGTRLGGRGVTPDIDITASWRNFSEANDPYLLVAADLLAGE